ncbi:MAG: GMC family oxidoreductase [Acidobacteria bacterium]|nr:GMC family oxidoreductase [Acidobacteriota bacterium]
MAQSNIPDVCIVGTGAAGGIMMYELARRDVSVVALEAGRRHDPSSFVQDELHGLNELYWSEPRTAVGREPCLPFGGVGVGGGSLHYGGASNRYHESDFRVKSQDGVAADWPISYRDLEPYYELVEREIGVAGLAGENPYLPPSKPYPMPPHPFNFAAKVFKKGCDKLNVKLLHTPAAINSVPYDGRPSCRYAAYCLTGCDWGAKGSTLVTVIPKAEKLGARIIPEAFAFRLNLDKSGRVRSISYFDREKREQEQKAKVFVLCAGGVETPRLLLLSKSSSFPDGLANSSGLVGKNFMVHGQAIVYARFPHEVGAGLSYKGNSAHAEVRDFYETNRKNSFVRGYTLTVMVAPPLMFLFFKGRNVTTWGRELKDEMREYPYTMTVWVCGDQLPQESNRVELDPTVVDSFRIPVARTVHAWCSNDVAVMKAGIEKTKEICDAAGARHFTATPMPAGLGGSAHLLGTCRMGDDPRTSIVDAFGRSHDVKNLFIAAGSVFPTSGAVSPTLTIQALAARTAHYIAQAARKGDL